MCDHVPVLDLAALRADMVESYRAWESRVHAYGTSYMDKAISGAMASDLQNIAARYHVNPSWQYLRVARAITTLDANLSVLLTDANPVKLLKQYFRQAQKRAVRTATRQLSSQVASTASDVSSLIDRTSTLLRRGEIEMSGVQTTTNYLVGLFFKGLRIITGALLILFTFDFLYRYHTRTVAGIHGLLGNLGNDLTEFVPDLSYGVSILAMLTCLFLFILFHKAARRVSRRSVRLPSGELAE